jgi:hypothetical protein
MLGNYKEGITAISSRCAVVGSIAAGTTGVKVFMEGLLTVR